MPSFAEIEFFIALNNVRFTLQYESGFRMDKTFKILEIVEITKLGSPSL